MYSNLLKTPQKIAYLLAAKSVRVAQRTSVVCMSCSSNFLKNVSIYQNPWFSFLSELIYIEILNCLETNDFLDFLLLQLPKYSTSQLHNHWSPNWWTINYWLQTNEDFYPKKKTYEDSQLCYQYCVILYSWPSSKVMRFCGVFVRVSCGVSHKFLACRYEKHTVCAFYFYFLWAYIKL